MGVRYSGINTSFTRSPVGYVSGTKPKVSAKFLFQCSTQNPPSKIWIRGTHEKLNSGDVRYFFAPKEVQFSIGTEIEYPTTESDKAFLANKINHYDYNFIIKWEYSLSSNGPWKFAGESVNPVYVTLKPPISKNPGNGYDYFQTLIHIGCKYGVGSSSYTSMFFKIRNYFNARNVLRCDQIPMQYYGFWTCVNITTRSLIGANDGQCGSWARLFIDIFKMQGFQTTNNYIIIKPKNDNGFYVKTWKFSDNPGSSGNPNNPYLNRSFVPSSSNVYEPYFPTGGFNWQVSSNPESPQVTDDTPGSSPLPGQNNPHPQSRFGNHQFIKMFGIYYDPSYGVSYSDISKIDEAVGAFFNINNKGANFEDWVRKNPSGIDIDLEVMSY
jgi:hypothetical protein